MRSRHHLLAALERAQLRIAIWAEKFPDPVWAGLAPDPGKVDPDLTEGELDVLIGVSFDLSSKEIAATLSISPETVKSRSESVRMKFGMKSTAGAACAAIRLGLIP